MWQWNKKQSEAVTANFIDTYCVMCYTVLSVYPQPICICVMDITSLLLHTVSAFFLGGCRGMRTLKHVVNLTGESKN
jgi:hypothetical protein